MDPWQVTTITLLSVIGVVGLGSVGVKYKDYIPAGISEIPALFFTFVANIMPFGLVVYGFVGDMINQSGPRLSIPSIAAVGSIILVGVVSQIIATQGSMDLSEQETSGMMWCTIPGFEGVESPYFPTAFMSTAIVAFYYLSWAWSTNQPSGFLGMTFAIIYFVQVLVFAAGDCSSSYKPPFGGIFGSIAISTLLGVGIGGAAWAATGKATQYNPFNISLGSASAANGCPAGYSPIGDHTCKENMTNMREHMTDKKKVCEYGYEMRSGVCVPTGIPPGMPGQSQEVQGGGDENTFVAELYKNGQLVTDTIAA
jgi:hypothetical protein